MTMPPGPSDPYGQPQQPPTPPPYGAPPVPVPPAYGAPQYGAPNPGQWAGPPLANWGQRVGASLIDAIPGIVAGTVMQASSGLGALLELASLVWLGYILVLQGNTGQTVGKRVVGIKLLREQDGQVVGVGTSIGRYFLHIVDALPCLLGYLWPLWDAKRQTFADKILHTVVIVA